MAKVKITFTIDNLPEGEEVTDYDRLSPEGLSQYVWDNVINMAVRGHLLTNCDLAFNLNKETKETQDRIRGYIKQHQEWADIIMDSQYSVEII